ncbi:MAG: hypothetical protein U1E65_20355 [Myxococcota bacterium]
MRPLATAALTALLGAVLLNAIACGPSPTLTRVEDEVFKPSCTFSACHSAMTPQKGLDLTGKTHAKLVGVVALEKPSMKLVEAGNPDASYVMDKLLKRNIPTSTVEAITEMPPGLLLEQERLTLVKDWISAGALDN